MDLVLRATGSKDPKRAYALAVRDFGSGIEVEWTYLCFMDEFSAYELVDTNTPYFWAGDPEEGEEAKTLRLDHSGLREAWDSYQVLKALARKSK